MAHASVSNLRGEPPDDGIPPVELYKNAVDEYRFQVQFNWSRTQYLPTGVQRGDPRRRGRPVRAAGAQRRPRLSTGGPEMSSELAGNICAIALIVAGIPSAEGVANRL